MKSGMGTGWGVEGGLGDLRAFRDGSSPGGVVLRESPWLAGPLQVRNLQPATASQSAIQYHGLVCPLRSPTAEEVLLNLSGPSPARPDKACRLVIMQRPGRSRPQHQPQTAAFAVDNNTCWCEERLTRIPSSCKTRTCRWYPDRRRARSRP